MLNLEFGALSLGTSSFTSIVPPRSPILNPFGMELLRFEEKPAWPLEKEDSEQEDSTSSFSEEEPDPELSPSLEELEPDEEASSFWVIGCSYGDH